MARWSPFVKTLALCIILAASGVSGWWIARRASLNSQRDTAIAQFGAQTAQDAPCAQGIRRDTLLVNFPAKFYAGKPGDLVNGDSVDVVPAGQSISAFYNSTFGAMRTITAVVVPDLLPPNPTFIPFGNPQTVDTLAPLIRKAGQVMLNTAIDAGTDFRFAGCLGAENQSPPVVYDAIIGDRLLLTGWRLAGDSGAGVLTLTLNWHVQAPDIDDVGVFIQVFDTSGNLVVETRGYPLAGAAPSRLWRMGDQWRDAHVIHVNSTGVLNGNCRILVGLYTTADGELLHAYDLAGKRLPGDMATINTAVK